MKTALIIPTRARPALFLRAAQAAIALASGPVEVYGVIDCDETADYQGEPHVTILHSPDSGSSNKAFDWAWRQIDADVIVMCGDDNVFRTQDWDRMLTEHFECDPFMLIALNNGRNRVKLEMFACTRQWAEAVGFILDTRFEHFCADELIERIAKKAQRMTYAMDIVCEHMHPKFGKGEWDETYRMKRGNGGNERDAARLELMLINGEIDAAATRISEAAGKLEEMKEAA